MTPPDTKCVMIVAGEASGDLHGAHLINALRKKDPGIFVFGIGGQRMRKAGMRILFDTAQLSVMGITEVFSRLPMLFKAMGIANKLLDSLKPDLLIVIDFADFNLRLAAKAKKTGIPVLYYIPPKAWAWRSGRVRIIRQRVDHAAVILPFEADFYQAHGLPATFVGHPLLDNSDLPIIPLERIEKNMTTIGLLPGSRKSEINRLLPVMLETARFIQRKQPQIRFLVSVAPSADRHFIEALTKAHPVGSACVIREAAVTDIFQQVAFLVAASGTVTLEAALAGIPMLIAYKMSTPSYLLGRALIHVEHVGLANLIAGEEIVPEYLQNAAKPEVMAEKVLKILSDKRSLSAMHQNLLRVREQLGGAGASDRTAEIALKMTRGIPVLQLSLQ